MIGFAGLEILDTLDELVDPKHTALLLWDFAENVVLNRYSTDELTHNSSRLLAAAREHSVLTIKAYLAQSGIDVRGETYADYSQHKFDADGRVAKQADAFLDRLVFEHVPEEVV